MAGPANQLITMISRSLFFSSKPRFLRAIHLKENKMIVLQKNQTFDKAICWLIFDLNYSNKSVGYIWIEEGDNARVDSISILPEHQKKEIGTKVYLILAEYYRQKGMAFISDNIDRSSAANALWKKLARIGRAKQNDSKTFSIINN